MAALPTPRRLIIAGLSLLAAASLPGCGQTGDLVLPKRRPPARQVPVEPPPPTPAADALPTEGDDSAQPKTPAAATDR